MFIDVDYTKKPQKAKLHLAKPNKQIISHLSEKYQDSLALKLGNINELSFSLPHFIANEETGQQEKNPHIEMVREKMLIKVQLSTYLEWFVVDSIEEDGDDSDTFNVSAFSLGFELKAKRFSGFETEGMTAKELGDEILKESVWKIRTIDPLFTNMSRSFESGEDGNILESIIQWAETFGGLLVWHSEAREISLLNMSTYGKHKGLIIDYGKYLRSIKRSRTTDNMPTRLYIYGSEDMTIHGVNPTGMGYIEDFSHYMYPFERDANKKTLKQSHFMSDALCHAILDHQLLVKNNSPYILQISGLLTERINTRTSEETVLAALELEYDTIYDLWDVAKATEDATLTAQKKKDLDAKKVEVDRQKAVIKEIQDDIDAYNKQLDTLQNDLSNQASFTPALRDELNLYIYDAVWRDDRYIDAEELLADGIKQFEEIRKPKIVIEVTMENLMNIVEEQYYWDKLVLGDLIKVRYPQMNIEYMAKIIEINYDLDAGEANLVVANTTDLLSDTEKFTQLLYNSQSASTLISNNKYKWDKVNAVQKEINELMTSVWNANKNKIIAGVNNSIEIGNRGIITTNPNFPNEIVIIQSGIIAMSKNGGTDWQTGMTADGIIAERLIGQIIAGQELLITNSAGSFTLDANGAVFEVGSFIIRSSTGGRNLVDRWEEGVDFVDAYRDDNLITAYEKKMLKIKWEEISSRYTANATKITNYYPVDGTHREFINVYHNRYDEIYAYLFTTPHGDKPMLADDNLEYTTRIIGEDFNAVFRNYDVALVELEKQLDIQASELTKKAIDDAAKAQKSIDEIMDDVVYKIEIRSSGGWIFKNGQINTVLSAKIYRGTDDITDTIPVTGFIWTKTDKDGNIDTTWNNLHKSVGKAVTITRDHVNQKAVFQCDISIEE